LVLPSRYEPGLLFLQQVIVEGFTADIYWSSTDGIGRADAYAHHFGNGAVINSFKHLQYRVRAVRSF